MKVFTPVYHNVLRSLISMVKHIYVGLWPLSSFKLDCLCPVQLEGGAECNCVKCHFILFLLVKGEIIWLSFGAICTDSFCKTI